MVFAPSQTIWDSPEGALTVWRLLAPSGSLLQLPRPLWHRRRLYRSLLRVPRWSGRFSGSVADCLGVSCR
ncbi:hypothetical protein DPMN_013995 [Dreissena polymorpha]|uniref:Uncharacterized protein n=1 Tax=Dreissena polymorpha TaxID=45954 RepID=A0A9D4N8L2_DREPO|nr:hypothetical protein DPMN_013995 [Dreissena polymorpha]